MSKESSPESNIEFEEKVKVWYQAVLKDLNRGGFQLTPTDATYLRQTIREIFKKNDMLSKKGIDMNRTFTYPEIFQSFFWHYYGINLNEYFKNYKWTEQDEKATKDLYRYVQKLRKDRELI